METPASPPADVSAVVIARNEEGNIVDAIGAVLKALERAKADGLDRKSVV